jgi:hypothetical protein
LGAAEEDNTQPADGLPAGWTLCVNEHQGYAVGYPARWHAPALSAESECTFFDPRRFELPENSDVYGAALQVAPAQQPFDVVARSLTDPRFQETVTRDELEVGGRHAVRVEARATGEGLYERGLLTYTYLLDRGARPPLMLQAFRAPRSKWAQRKSVLDRAARSIVLFVPREEAPSGLPDAVERKRAAILSAADRGDLDALAELADPRGFEYTFGGPVEGGPAAYWRMLERDTDEKPIEALKLALRLPYTLSRGVYVWPFAFDKTDDELTDYERQLLGTLLARSGIGDSGYLGWRAGITPDGRWVFFVAGD